MSKHSSSGFVIVLVLFILFIIIFVTSCGNSSWSATRLTYPAVLEYAQ
ncbi:hypothetical protein WAK64_20845 [Bacillus spongiae]|uniref:YjcZ family sporulation protein n=1 Tax=Bacillus spongiae TaxID=2683610 RepID=A0ABU8HJE3_9BACI